MANRIFFNPDGYVEVTVDGDQTAMTFENLKADAQIMLEDLQKKGLPRLGLIDLDKEGAFTPESNKAALEILESLTYDRLAIFGGKKINQEISKAIILAMGKMSDTKVFKDRDSAVKWVLEPLTK
jgi:hypothetical protein